MFTYASTGALKSSARLLIIRFSSFGDIAQATGIPSVFQSAFPGAKADWLVRSDLSGLLTSHPLIDRVISFDRRLAFFGLVKLAWKISGETPYTHVYDAHNNLRSTAVVTIFRFRSILNALAGKPVPNIAVRSKQRIRRWLFFKLRLPVLPKGFRGAESFLLPIQRWGIDATKPHKLHGRQFWPSAHEDDFPESLRVRLAGLKAPVIAAAPSAAWEMKRWPVAHWKTLIQLMPDQSFVLLGGPEDQFLAEIAAVAPERVLNFAGQLSLAGSGLLLTKTDLLIANDTGLLHVADQMERPAIALIGPTAFGYPSHATSRTLEVKLFCKPCSKDGRGHCRNDVYQRCLVDLDPKRVAETAREMLNGAGA